MARLSLDEILNHDPFNLLADVKAKNPILTNDDRLIASFEEINEFYEKNGYEPKKSTDMQERKLFSRLQGIKNDPSKKEILKKYDRFDLLKEIEINSIEDIFDYDPLGLLGGEEEEIFVLKNVPKIDQKRADPDFVAKREKCEDFDKYKNLFIKCQQDLKDGSKKLVPPVEKELRIGTFCVLDGLLLYIANIEKGYRGNSGKINRRTTIIFENGTKSHMLLRSLGKRLKENGKMVIEDILQKDKQKGYIYILESLSKDDRIATKKNLYKIGFSTTAVEERVKNASQDPTYLMADVKIVSVFEVYNINPQKLEHLIHKFFYKSCLDIDIVDKKGVIHKPREWFIAPLDVIEEVIRLIISGDIVDYKYDGINEKIYSK